MYAGVPNKRLCSFVIFQDFFQPVGHLFITEKVQYVYLFLDFFTSRLFGILRRAQSSALNYSSCLHNISQISFNELLTIITKYLVKIGPLKRGPYLNKSALPVYFLLLRI